MKLTLLKHLAHKNPFLKTVVRMVLSFLLLSLKYWNFFSNLNSSWGIWSKEKDMSRCKQCLQNLCKDWIQNRLMENSSAFSTKGRPLHKNCDFAQCFSPNPTPPILTLWVFLFSSFCLFSSFFLFILFIFFLSFFFFNMEQLERYSQQHILHYPVIMETS